MARRRPGLAGRGAGGFRPRARGPARLVHRGDCHAVRGLSHPVTTDQTRATRARPDAATCPVCRPHQPLGRLAG
ncbi:DUF6233 domain-containing protein [Streptomyces sp. NPDC006733]|uniref:DUF6233 domain-containing protein n=1 Tax=Streptomyces sp. NPDC006733 TaxID=3155460 RepID=UPI0033F5847D